VSNALADYFQGLKEGVVFSRNQYGKSTVFLTALSENPDRLLVVCNNPQSVKQWSLAKVFIDDHFFVHESLGTFFSREEAEKQFTLEQGLEWEGGDSIDDYS